MLLGCLEVVQFYEGCEDYVKDLWNWIDAMQIITFQILMQVRIAEFSNGEEIESSKYIKFFLFVLTNMKALHFMSAFEELGFFIDLLFSSIAKLSTFFFSYVVFGMIFAVLYIVIGNEPGEAFDTSVGLGIFGKMFLFVWGNGACSFGLMNYPGLWNTPTNDLDEAFFKQVNIWTIWLLYIMQVQFQTMFGLNFIIAIVEENYQKMLPLRK
jgi:hypothetical protein